MVAALDRMSDKHRYIVAQFARRTRAPLDEVDLFLRDLTERIERVRAMLYDKARTSFTLVTIPEALAVEESVRYLALLQAEGVPVTDLIINRVEQAHADCRYCRARVRNQRPHLQELARAFASLRQHQVPLLAEEVRGRDALRRFAALAWPDEGAARKRQTETERQATTVRAAHASVSDAAPAAAQSTKN